MTFVWFTLLTLAVFFLMEGVAWTTHRYIMHGPLGWGWHRDHHEPHDKTFELNDLYGVVGAVVGTSPFVVAWLTDLWWVRAIALG
ncbi:MAG: beta-carotene hydroxylase, partial [Brevundimonas sp.]